MSSRNETQARIVIMDHLTYPLILWISFLLISLPYVMWAKHRAAKPLASYLIFVTILSAAAWFGFSLFAMVARGFPDNEVLAQSSTAIVIFALSLLAGFVIASRQIRKPPKPAPPI